MLGTRVSGGKISGGRRENPVCLGTNDGSIYQVDFLVDKNVGFDEDATEGRRQENN